MPSSTLKNAQYSETRWACCMLCVTMTIVTVCRSSCIVSSMRRVDVGSRAEHGSSISSTWGLTASERAMHSRCCCPPDRAPPGRSSRFLTSFHRPARVQAVLDQGVGVRALHARQAQTGKDVLRDGHRRERVRLLEDHADAPADVGDAHIVAVDVDVVQLDLARQLRARHQLVHPVQDPQERRLAASGGPDQGGDRVRSHVEVDRPQHVVVAEPRVHLARRQRRRGGRIAQHAFVGSGIGRLHHGSLGTVVIGARSSADR